MFRTEFGALLWTAAWQGLFSLPGFIRFFKDGVEAPSVAKVAESRLTRAPISAEAVSSAQLSSGRDCMKQMSVRWAKEFLENQSF